MKITRLLCLAGLLAGATCGWAVPIVHNYDLKNVLWKLSFSMDRGTILGEVTNTVTMLEDSPEVEFHSSDLTILDVFVNGKEAGFHVTEGKLAVTLPSSHVAGKTLKIRTLYKGSPVSGLYFVPAAHAFPAKTGMIYTQGQGEDNHYWLPTYDYPDDKATTECFVTVPAKWTAVSNGKLMDVANSGNTRIFHWKMDQPYSTYLITLVAGEYVRGGDTWHGIPVDYYVPPGLEAQGKASFAVTSKMIDSYSRLTGVDYPYAKFAQEVVGDFMFGGMENVTAVTQTIRTLHAAGTEPLNDSTYLVAHELAHHWFGDLITCRTWEHSWLNEGFATTLPMYYIRETRGLDAFDMSRYRNFEGAVDTFGSRGRKDVPGEAGSVKTISMGSVYDGGSSRILMLMHKLGGSVFWHGIHEFLETYKFQPVTTAQFFEVMSRISRQDLSEFEKQWFHTAATPSLTATVVDGDLIVDQYQPYYTLDIPVWILDGTTWVKKGFHIEGAQSKLHLGELAGKPLLIDPEVWTPMELRYGMPYSDKDVSSLYANAPNVASKARIISELFDYISVNQRIAIGQGEKYFDLLTVMAPHIGQDGIPFLLHLTHHSDVRVVNAAVVALGHLKPTPEVQARLKDLSERHPNETLRERAMQARLSTTDDISVANEAWAMKAFDDGFIVMALDWWGTHDANAARTMSLQVLKNPGSEPLRVAAIKVLGVVKDLPGETAVFKALQKVAIETSYAARNAAVKSLGLLGNPDALPTLQKIAAHAPNGIKGSAAAAIEVLKKTP